MILQSTYTLKKSLYQKNLVIVKKIKHVSEIVFFLQSQILYLYCLCPKQPPKQLKTIDSLITGNLNKVSFIDLTRCNLKFVEKLYYIYFFLHLKYFKPSTRIKKKLPKGSYYIYYYRWLKVTYFFCSPY